MLVHHLLPQHHGEELVVGDVLDEGGHDMTRLLSKDRNKCYQFLKILSVRPGR